MTNYIKYLHETAIKMHTYPTLSYPVLLSAMLALFSSPENLEARGKFLPLLQTHNTFMAFVSPEEVRLFQLQEPAALSLQTAHSVSTECTHNAHTCRATRNLEPFKG